MPAKEIKELRLVGKLNEALAMAKTELQVQPDNIWPKRNISWVYYDYLKENVEKDNLDVFITYLVEIQKLQLPATETILFDNVCWKIGSMIFKTVSKPNFVYLKLYQVYEIAQTFDYSKPSEGYSFLFKALHKFLKDGDKYIQFADWWNFDNFREEDFQNDKMPDGKDMMSIVEQAYIAYGKHLLPKVNYGNETIFNKEKAVSFIEKLTVLDEKYSHYTYPQYYKAKLLLATGDRDNMLVALLPFAKKKQSAFWVWDVLADAFITDVDKVFSCYCKGLLCKSPAEMVIGLRQKIAKILISKNLYNEAKTEVLLIEKVKIDKKQNIPAVILNWQSQEWYKNAVDQKSNINFYKKHISEAESILFYDVPEENVIVENVNIEKKILNFIASESKYGFLKYDRFFRDVKIGDILKVRFQGGSNEGMHQLYTAIKINDETFKSKFLKEVEGLVKIPSGKLFGFVNDIFINPSLLTNLKLTEGMNYKGKAMKTFNKEKKQWSWKLI